MGRSLYSIQFDTSLINYYDISRKQRESNGNKMPSKPLIVGITGPFGSGCTSYCNALAVAPYNFNYYKLSKIVWDKWEEQNTGKDKKEALRSELQDIGNNLRREHGDGYLALKTWEDNAFYEKISNNESIVIDNIRNLGEVEFFRGKHPNFHLIAICCSPAEQWNRSEPEYKERNSTKDDFLKELKRDQKEGFHWGQQVDLCVYEAEIVIINEEHHQDKRRRLLGHQLEIDNYIQLLEGKEKRTPTEQETYMNIAYSASQMSMCIKRQVGAVIIDQKKNVISVGHNDPPVASEQCIMKYGKCYRDIVRKEFFSDLKTNCPNCKVYFENIKFPFYCPSCKINLEDIFFKDRIINRCRSLHAEEKAIINAGLNGLKNSTMYITTFPCNECAKKILYTGIEEIYYVEPYPDEDSYKLLTKSQNVNIEIKQFKGVKRDGYFKLLGSWRRKTEEEITKK